MALLEISEITKRFGALTVLDKVTFDVNQGEIVGLIGPNGAGKTTLFNVITGYLRPNSGKVYFKGKNLVGLSMEDVANQGIVRTFQTPTIWSPKTLLENVRIGLHLRSKVGFWEAFFHLRSARAHRQQEEARAMELLSFMGLDGMANQLAANQSFGRRRGLGVAIALAVEPDLLMLDEPVTGMMASENKRMMERIRKIRDELGITVLVVEHHMKFVMGLCDRIVALNFGVKIAEGTPEYITSHQAVIDAYLGVD